jgi:hypothetical protein
MVKLAILSSLLTLAATTVSAAPAAPLKRGSVTDKQILSFALTLEHLENAFYQGGLAKYSEADFEKEGFPSFTRGRISQIAEHEATHVAFLTGAIGAGAPVACEYSFPDNTVAEFISLSAALETGGVSAYLGAAHLLQNPDYITEAGSIMTTEARQAAWVISSALHGSAWSGSFDVPLDANQIISIVHGFITSCPSSNPPLIATPFPALTVSAVNPGQEATVTFTKPSANKSYFLALFHGLKTSVVPIENGKAKIPEGLQGTVFAVVTDSATDISDANTVAGTAVLSFAFTSSANNS